MQRNKNIKFECCLHTIKPAVLQRIALLSIFLSKDQNFQIKLGTFSTLQTIDRETIEFQTFRMIINIFLEYRRPIYEGSTELVDQPLIREIIDYKFKEDNADFTILLKALNDMKICIGDITLTISHIRIDLITGELSLAKNIGISICDVTSPYTNCGEINLTLLIFAWTNYHKIAYCQLSDDVITCFYDIVVCCSFLQFHSNDGYDHVKICSYLAIRFWDREALAELNNIGTILVTCLLDETNCLPIEQRKQIEIKRIKFTDASFVSKFFPDYDVYSDECPLSPLFNKERAEAIDFLRINYKKNVKSRCQRTTAEISYSNFSQIFLTCVIAFFGLGAAAYLLLGNFLFNYILPFCELKNYVFTGIISVISIFLIVTSIIRTYNICKYSPDGIANSNRLLRFFKTLEQSNTKELREEQTALTHNLS
jgi:hypothetical protein